MRKELAYSCTRLLASRWIGSRDVDSTLLKNTLVKKGQIRSKQLEITWKGNFLMSSSVDFWYRLISWSHMNIALVESEVYNLVESEVY